MRANRSRCYPGHPTNMGLHYLKGLENLRELDLAQTRISNDALPHLVELTSLQRVGLAATRVTTEGVRQLQEAMPDLLVIW